MELDALLRSRCTYGVSENGLLSAAEAIGNRVASDTVDVGSGLREHLAVLDVQAADLGEVTAVGAVGGDELGHDGKDLTRVNGLTRTVKGCVAHAVGVEVTAVSIAVALVSVAIARAAVSVRGASGVRAADVRSDGIRDAVCFPNVHFATAGTDPALAGVRGRSIPVLAVGLATDELEVARTLSGRRNVSNAQSEPLLRSNTYASQ